MTSEFGNRASFAVSNTRALFIVGDPTVKCFAIPEYRIEREREIEYNFFFFFFGECTFFFTRCWAINALRLRKDLLNNLYICEFSGSASAGHTSKNNHRVI